MNPSTSTALGALFVADNLALDFINTEYGVGEQRHDCLVDDHSVLGWLKAAGQLPAQLDAQIPQGLLALARQLRECSRQVVNAAMDGNAVDLSVINQVLEAGRPLRRLEWNDEARAFRVAIQPRDNRPASLLEPVAEALVSLVTSDKFEFVRQCEAQDCVLLFHDLTKSHRRRWCSMATCGNRMKVAAFRSRKKP
ncbi:CGNR zinc finger domain-containing protein [Pseudomonas caricapapayae]|uniref:CGNR zinc finger domain-containing protein n=1 Tax=Pseudomonas caricapapayae TaxID=46678 RepID=A0ACC7M171_9PSED